MEDNLNSWMEDVRVSSMALPEGKGIVAAIYEPTGIKTRFGDKKVMQVVINGKDGSTVSVKVFVPDKFPAVHPKSNLAKIMQRYGCRTLRELIGKEVEVEQIGDMLWKIVE